MKKRTRTRKSLTVKKRIVGFFAIAVILLGVVGGFSINKVIAESDSTAGNDAAAPVAVLAKTSDSSTSGAGGAATNANVLVGDNTGTSTGSQTQAKDTDYTPSVNVNNMSTYPQTGDAHDTGLVILGFTILIGLFAFYGLKFRKSFQSLHVSKVTN
ncbi:LPXTG cell wall anchor domain-containing protein [Companilactobacillus bobalius]|uniref:Gram-positive cocci surface proteins LPxTG domain-containing protein n=2 Tax=Companilactobacillus bobalius TaxID=2801451 RepID=A0A202FCK1_9LACO|nr:LPXTG cell wall anchor domain-containing protein [Companilactobacillus bobalius]GEO58543.1 hypothetical protein LBO01_16720 [Companilactobacillus paralimentarius]KAE9557520.1 hypothetical protein ATN92_15225 [Companilactobacillus bobalius]KAE9561591.1 hypothetical protein ATN92_05780 [Companilactobacillus bobalius]KAE9563667.1 hypothetical protein ATN92_02710 [Companilactobacillus bobalius]KRK82490.1 hypothetical protein FC78_GL002499 [Companilactobacillus bobalius DSM 19674]